MFGRIKIVSVNDLQLSIFHGYRDSFLIISYSINE